uniref:Uncharacterized protein n=1 Tax=Ciona intestinalis TaxID=7719 RepID=H2Y1S6_CIOIN
MCLSIVRVKSDKCCVVLSWGNGQLWPKPHVPWRASSPMPTLV